MANSFTTAAIAAITATTAPEQTLKRKIESELLSVIHILLLVRIGVQLHAG